MLDVEVASILVQLDAAPAPLALAVLPPKSLSDAVSRLHATWAPIANLPMADAMPAMEDSVDVTLGATADAPTLWLRAETAYQTLVSRCHGWRDLGVEQAGRRASLNSIAQRVQALEVASRTYGTPSADLGDFRTTAEVRDKVDAVYEMAEAMTASISLVGAADSPTNIGIAIDQFVESLQSVCPTTEQAFAADLPSPETEEGVVMFCTFVPIP
jgi:hypothetical protein